ncbi:hypothetical protein [Plantactinospora sp. DSM 117369]
MGVDAVKATIRQGTEAAREGIERLRQLATESTETNELARRTTQGSRDDDVVAGLALLGDVQGEVERTVRRLATAVDHAETYAKRLG